MSHKTIRVALVGPPNAGKSTLINSLVGQKIAIITHKAQTTRSSSLAVITRGDTQTIFFDTPGLFTPRKNHKLEKTIVNDAIKTLKEVDLILLLFDAYLLNLIIKDDENKELDKKLLPYHEALEILAKNNRKKFLVIANKLDTVKNSKALEELENYQKVFERILPEKLVPAEKEIIAISALQGTNLDRLLDKIEKYAIEEEWSFSPETFTTVSERTLAEEITREQIYLLLDEELPYSIRVETDLWKEQEDGSLMLHQSILVIKPSQKNIIIGAKGQKIKKIGEEARLAISQALGYPVHLFLHVKVRNWIEKL